MVEGRLSNNGRIGVGQEQSIFHLIEKNLREINFPVLLIGILLLLLYFAVNAYITDRNQQILLGEVRQNVEQIAAKEALAINGRLQEISAIARIIQKDHETFFADADNCFLPNGKPKFGFTAEGVYYKLRDNGGASLYYSGNTDIGTAQKRKALCSERLGPLLKSVVRSHPAITQGLPEDLGQYEPSLSLHARCETITFTM